MEILVKMGKNRSIRKMAKRMPVFLVDGYGSSEAYSQGQIDRAIEETGCNSEYADHAYAMFCSEETFAEISSEDYSQIHQEVADVCFSGDSSFGFTDALSISQSSGHGDSGGFSGDGGDGD